MEYIIIGILGGLLLLGLILLCFFLVRNKRKSKPDSRQVEVQQKNIETLAAYVQAEKEQKEKPTSVAACGSAFAVFDS